MSRSPLARESPEHRGRHGGRGTAGDGTTAGIGIEDSVPGDSLAPQFIESGLSEREIAAWSTRRATNTVRGSFADPMSTGRCLAIHLPIRS